MDDSTIDAGAGDDTIYLTGHLGDNVNVLGGEGNDSLYIYSTAGTAVGSDVTIDAGAGDDTVYVTGEIGRNGL